MAADALSGSFRGDTHVLPMRVYYEDTDAGGVVYHANYLRFAERARTEMMRALGAEHTAMLTESGIGFTVRRCDADFILPARLDDTLEVCSRITHVGGASLRAEQIVRRDGADLARLELKLACLDRNGRPVRLPDRVRAALATLSTYRQDG
jgi:acyl-CoA thioester hydrolase